MIIIVLSVIFTEVEALYWSILWRRQIVIGLIFVSVCCCSACLSSTILTIFSQCLSSSFPLLYHLNHLFSMWIFLSLVRLVSLWGLPPGAQPPASEYGSPPSYLFCSIYPSPAGQCSRLFKIKSEEMCGQWITSKLIDVPELEAN